MSYINVLSRIESIFKSKSLSDIIFIGYIDGCCNPTVFHPLPEKIYLEFEEEYLSLQSVEQYSLLEIDFSKEINFDLPYFIDEDDTLTSTSVGDFVLDETTMKTHKVSGAKAYGLVENKKSTSLVCSALELTLSTGQLLFFDPTYNFGIKIGSEKQKEIWKDNLFSDYPKERVIFP